MKKALFILVCLVTMMAAGTSLKAQEVTIVLNPGWTWISNPTIDTVDFATALGSFTPMSGDAIKSQWGNAYYRNGRWAGSISQFYPGYGYKYYSNRNVPVMLTFNVQQPTQQVVVTTSEPMLITAISAMGGGEVTVSNGTYIIVKGLCWATHENPTTNDDFYEEAGSGVGSFSISMTELNIGTTYYLRAYAVTPNGTVYGNQKTFTTRDGIPTLTTAEVTNITGATATCGGNITDNGGLNVTARGVCWSTSPNPTVADSHTTNGSGNGSFSSSITGLSVSTTYYVRAYATTAAGTGYGEEKTFTTRDGIPTLTTDAIWNITGNSARSGGNITDNGGLNVTARGVCWSITPDPTVSNSHTTNGTGMGGFNSIITGLDFSTTYYVRAYATTNAGTGYGNQLSFTTENDLAFIDLGLPSGTLWATYNVGADNPEDYGNYFAWGETQPKDVYNWSTYQYCNGSSSTLTKYCYNSNYGNNGFTDCLVILLPEDDAATAYWGEDWRLPTKVEWKELYQNTTVRWTLQNGVYGRLFTASNGNSLFLPAAGYRNNSDLSENGVAGDYLSSSLYTSIPNRAWEFNFGENNYGISSYGHRKLGLSVRAVRSSKPNNDYVDLGLPSGLLWATCNVGAYAPWNSGDYFAWGETQPKSTYDWSTYQYCNDSDHTFTKYCNNSEYGYNGFTDNLTVLLPEDDAATANLGGNWRMPTEAEWEELYQNTTVSGEWEHGEYGLCFTAGNGNSIFLPAVSCIPWEGMSDTGEFGYYWSSSLTTDPSSAWNFRFYSGDYHVSYSMESRYRFSGRSVRAVRSASQSGAPFIINVTANPVEGGMTTGGGTYEQGQYCTLTATANEGYIFNNWTENGSVVSTNANYTFTVNNERTLVANFTYNGGGDTHAYVDLGLPSGLLWATCNVGAETPEGYGDYFAWGETTPKDDYDWSTYQYSNDDDEDWFYLTKYCNNSESGYNGFTDNLTTLLPEDDAATANWGNSWRMPTLEEWQELYNNTTVTWTTQNDVNGRLFTASNGNSLFLPAAGYRYYSSLSHAGSYGLYWSSSLYTDSPHSAWSFYFRSGSYSVDYYGRDYGQSVRPVCSSRQN